MNGQRSQSNQPRQLQPRLRLQRSQTRGHTQVKNRNFYSDNFIVTQHDYTYNGVGQRKSAQDRLGIYAPPAMNEAYAYDPLGNRTTKTDGSNPLYYVYDAANQLKEIRQTNAAGVLLTAMIYDATATSPRNAKVAASPPTARLAAPAPASPR